MNVKMMGWKNPRRPLDHRFSLRNRVLSRTLSLLIAIIFETGIGMGQQASTAIAPIFNANAKYVQGVAPGYWPTAGAALTLNLAAGSAYCGNPPALVTYAAGSLTMVNAATNLVYLDPAASCAPAVSQAANFSVGQIPIAKVVTAGSVITTITDMRGAGFAPLPCAMSATGGSECDALGTNQNIAIKASGSGSVMMGTTSPGEGFLTFKPYFPGHLFDEIVNGGGEDLQMNLNGAVALSAGGTNQNITLTPSGTGSVLVKALDWIPKADQFTGADFGAKVTACIAGLPTGGTTGGTCDARGFTSTQTSASSITVPCQSTLLLPATKITFSGTNGIWLTGTSAGGCSGVGGQNRIRGSGSQSTVLAAGAGFTGCLLRIEPGTGETSVSDIAAMDMGFDLTAAPTAKAICGYSVRDPSSFHDLRIIDGTGRSIEFDSSTIAGGSISQGIHLYDIYDQNRGGAAQTGDRWLIRANEVTVGPNVSMQNTGTGTYSGLVIDSTTQNSGQYAGRSATIIANSIGGWTGPAINLTSGTGAPGPSGITIAGNRFEGDTIAWKASGFDASHLGQQINVHSNYYQNATRAGVFDFVQSSQIDEADPASGVAAIAFTACSESGTTATFTVASGGTAFLANTYATVGNAPDVQTNVTPAGYAGAWPIISSTATSVVVGPLITTGLGVCTVMGTIASGSITLTQNSSTNIVRAGLASSVSDVSNAGATLSGNFITTVGVPSAAVNYNGVKNILTNGASPTVGVESTEIIHTLPVGITNSLWTQESPLSGGSIKYRFLGKDSASGLVDFSLATEQVFDRKFELFVSAVAGTTPAKDMYAWDLATGNTDQAGTISFLEDAVASPTQRVTISGTPTALRTWTAPDVTGNIAVLPTASTTETGSGAVVKATSPTLVTPAIGAATGTSLVLTGQLKTGNFTIATPGTIVNAGTCASGGTVAISGLLTSSAFMWSASAALPATWQTGIFVMPDVSTAGTAKVWLCNGTAGNITPAALTLNIKPII